MRNFKNNMRNNSYKIEDKQKSFYTKNQNVEEYKRYYDSYESYGIL